MAKPKQSKRIKVRDLAPRNAPKGGGKKKQQQQDKYLVIKMEDLIVSS